MKQEEFDKIAMEAKGYREHIENIAKSGISEYRITNSESAIDYLTGLSVNKQSDPIFDIQRYITDNFGFTIDIKGYNFESWIDRRTIMIMSFNELAKEINDCNQAYANCVGALTLMNIAKEEQELSNHSDKIEKDYYEAKIQLASAVDNLVDKFFEFAKETRLY